MAGFGIQMSKRGLPPPEQPPSRVVGKRDVVAGASPSSSVRPGRAVKLVGGSHPRQRHRVETHPPFAGALRLITIRKSANLDPSVFGSMVIVDASRESVRVVLPKIEPTNAGKIVMIRRADSGDQGTQAVVMPQTDDTVESGGTDGAWIPQLGQVIGIGFGDTLGLCSDGLHNWLILSKPPISSVARVSGKRAVVLRDLDRTVILSGKDGEDIVAQLPTAVGKAGRELVVKVDQMSYACAFVQGVRSQTIDGATKRRLNPGDALTIVSDGINWIVTGEYHP